MAKYVIGKTFECLLAVATLTGLFALCWVLFGTRATCIIVVFEVLVWLWFAYEFMRAPIINDIDDIIE